MKVMTVEQVYRPPKGTVIYGKLEADIRPGEKVLIGEHPAMVFSMMGGWPDTLIDSAKAGNEVCLFFQGIKHLEIPEGTIVTKP